MQYNQYYGGLGIEPYQPQAATIPGMNMMNYSGAQQQVGYPGQNVMMGAQQQQMMRPKVDPRIFDTPQITMGEPGKKKTGLFTITDKGDTYAMIKVDNSSDAEVAAAKKKSKPKKVDTTETGAGVVKVDKKDTTVEPAATIYSYNETNNMLHETLGQIDAINSELVQEFNAVRHNRTMKNKYMVLTNLSENIGSLIGNRIQTIKEINNCISKANDLDYKKYKDIQAAQATMNDDKYIADVYQAMMANPQNQAPTYQMPTVNPSLIGTGVVRVNVNQNDLTPGANLQDIGYLNYIANMTPEERLMRYENDPDVKQVVVYDAATGARFFQVMNMRTGEVISGVPTYDNMIMEETTLDLNTNIAKNINLNEQFPIIQINNEVTSKY